MFFGLDPTLPLGLGILVASISVVLYYVSPTRLAMVESPRFSDKPDKSEKLPK